MGLVLMGGGGEGFLSRFLAVCLGLFFVYMATGAAGPFYVGVSKGRKSDGARPLPSWIARSVSWILASFCFLSVAPNLTATFEPTSASWFFFYLPLALLSLGGLYLSLTPGPTYLPLPKGSTKHRLILHRCLAVVASGFGLYFSVRGLIAILR